MSNSGPRPERILDSNWVSLSLGQYLNCPRAEAHYLIYQPPSRLHMIYPVVVMLRHIIMEITPPSFRNSWARQPFCRLICHISNLPTILKLLWWRHNHACDMHVTCMWHACISAGEVWWCYTFHTVTYITYTLILPASQVESIIFYYNEVWGDMVMCIIALLLHYTHYQHFPPVYMWCSKDTLLWLLWWQSWRSILNIPHDKLWNCKRRTWLDYSLRCLCT